MLTYELLRESAVLVLRPRGRLTTGDFERVGAAADRFLEERGHLAGVLVHTRVFPGYQSYRAFRAHVRFLRSHGDTVRRIAVVTDGRILSRVPAIVNRLLPAEVRRFPFEADGEALTWLAEGG